MSRSLEQKIGDLEAKIAHAMNTYDETVEAESRIDDMAYELLALEEKLARQVQQDKEMSKIEKEQKR